MRVERIDPRVGWMLRASGWLVALVAFGWLLGMLVVEVLFPDAQASADLRLARAVSSDAAPWLISTMRVATRLGDAFVVIAIAVVIAVAWRLTRRDWFAGALLVMAVTGATMLERIVKELVHRPRPAIAWLTEASGFSFPSGHATRAAALFGALAILCTMRWPRPRNVVIAWMVALTLVVIVAGSRLVLGVHHATDVLAGAGLGALWLTVCARMLQRPAPDVIVSETPFR